MASYYNEHDKVAVAWLIELIKDGLIADGEVDERSIEDVQPADLVGFRQCHFFAGIGGWSQALRLAGVSDDAPVWTGSCPCQPFSTAGKGAGLTDERHLWPAFHWLIAQCRPELLFGEQVASPAALGWWDTVSTDLEALDYACAACDLPAASVGADHIRRRLFWVADTDRERCDGQPIRLLTGESREAVPKAARPSAISRMGDSDDARSQGRLERGNSPNELSTGSSGVDYIPCADGVTRRIESGALPLVARLPSGVVPSGDPSASEARNTAEARVMRLRGYGNAIQVEVAAEFIRAYLDSLRAS